MTTAPSTPGGGPDTKLIWVLYFRKAAWRKRQTGAATRGGCENHAEPPRKHASMSLPSTRHLGKFWRCVNLHSCGFSARLRKACVTVCNRGNASGGEECSPPCTNSSIYAQTFIQGSVWPHRLGHGSRLEAQGGNDAVLPTSITDPRSSVSKTGEPRWYLVKNGSGLAGRWEKLMKYGRAKTRGRESGEEF